MNNSYLKNLEFDKIIEKLGSFCITYVAKNECQSLLPKTSKEDVKFVLDETNEAINLIYRNGSPSFLETPNIEVSVKRLENMAILSAKSLLELANIFKLSQELKNYFNKEFLDSTDYPILSKIFNMLYSNKSVVDKVFSCIIDENTIDDRASSNLQVIRKKQRKIEQDIRSKLNEFIHSAKYSKYIQESIITIRNDRFVVPVKEEYRSQIKGFVHDISNAGATIFIEPISIFELNNELNSLKAEEEIEIEKILQMLSSLFYEYTEQLREDVSLIGKLDFIFAKAKYSKSINGVMPIMNDKKYIKLINARHPLIEKDKVVPISLELGEETSVLLITGPNTGGKTVTLKTIGLLSCMACSGLNIPADEKSSIFVFDNVFADIGDNQSITESLSTFSSHMLNIIDIIKKSTPNSLILVDELGSGTDPLEGANLAISILEHFKKAGGLVTATTHYQELKNYALVTPGFKNASVEFDINTLSPTYRLLIGIPGKSNAFEISKKLGLDQDIIDNAKNMMSSHDISIEELLKNIYDDKSKIEKEKEEISKELDQTSLVKKKLEEEYSKFEIEKNNIIANAKTKARNILLEAKDEANEIIKEMKSISNSKDLNNLRNKLNEKIKNINEQTDLSQKTTGLPTQSEAKEYLSKDEIKVGMNVYVTTLNQNATIISDVSKSNTVQVQAGIIKMNVDIEDLRKLNNNSSKNTNKNTSGNKIKNIPNNVSTTGYTSISKTKNAKSEINVIGFSIEEAIFVIDKFLDDSTLAKLQTVRIVHGKGTGKLRKGIHEFLKKNPHVKSYRLRNFW